MQKNKSSSYLFRLIPNISQVHISRNSSNIKSINAEHITSKKFYPSGISWWKKILLIKSSSLRNQILKTYMIKIIINATITWMLSTGHFTCLLFSSDIFHNTWFGTPFLKERGVSFICVSSKRGWDRINYKKRKEVWYRGGSFLKRGWYFFWLIFSRLSFSYYFAFKVASYVWT